MLDKQTIFEIHRLAREGYSGKRIASMLKRDSGTVAKYLDNPDPFCTRAQRQSLLDPYKEHIGQLLARDPEASAAVILQHIAAKGFSGKVSILRDYLASIRPKPRRAFIRFESAPGEQCQTDWGHFGALVYGATARKLYCFAITECHSRMLYLEFTHSQNQQTLHRCLLNAFRFFGGTAKELVYCSQNNVTLSSGDFILFITPPKHNKSLMDFRNSPIYTIDSFCFCADSDVAKEGSGNFAEN